MSPGDSLTESSPTDPQLGPPSRAALCDFCGPWTLVSSWTFSPLKLKNKNNNKKEQKEIVLTSIIIVSRRYTHSALHPAWVS